MIRHVCNKDALIRVVYISNIIGQNVFNQSGSCGSYSDGSGDTTHKPIARQPVNKCTSVHMAIMIHNNLCYNLKKINSIIYIYFCFVFSFLIFLFSQK